MKENNKKDSKESKEEFCGACVAGLMALAGGGTAVYTRKERKKKKIIFWIAIAISIISILVLAYLLFVKECNKCTGN